MEIQDTVGFLDEEGFFWEEKQVTNTFGHICYFTIRIYDERTEDEYVTAYYPYEFDSYKDIPSLYKKIKHKAKTYFSLKQQQKNFRKKQLSLF